MQRIQLSGCGGCCSDDRSFFHDVRLRGVYRRLCTSCVLKSHPGLFCPLCFEVYQTSSSPPSERVLCVKCVSVAHLACVSDGTASSSYVCPPCSNAAFVFFDGGVANKKRRFSDGELISAGTRKAIDEKSARVIVAAARIAWVSMSKAAAAARTEAERRVKDAALARKRAGESLERFASLSSKEEKQLRAEGNNLVQRTLKNGVSVNKRDRVKGSPATVDEKKKKSQGAPLTSSNSDVVRKESLENPEC